MKEVCIFLDRDGTLLYDDKYHLGSQKDWKRKIKLLTGVISGLKRLQRIRSVKLFMISNQPGVAIREKPLLTEKRAHEVCSYVLDLFAKKGIHFVDYEVCGKASPFYVKRRSPEFTFDKKYVGNFSCIKPKIGMITHLLRKHHLQRKKVNIYVIGDRASDLKTALNAKGFGVYVPFSKEYQEEEKVGNIKNKNIYRAKNFLDACNFVLKKEKS